MADATYDTRAVNKMPPLALAKQTAFGTARETFEQAEALAARVENMVVRLIGHANQATGSANPARPDPTGIFDDLREGAHAAAGALSRANDALDRLDREY